jgi:hypothetical protein
MMPDDQQSLADIAAEIKHVGRLMDENGGIPAQSGLPDEPVDPVHELMRSFLKFQGNYSTSEAVLATPGLTQTGESVFRAS